jgi:maleylpyruvate isomerase
MGAGPKGTSLRLYHYWRSSSSWRVRFGFEHKGLHPALVHVNLLDDSSDQPEHKARNPMGYVPVLEFMDSGEASGPKRYMAESIAILEWADETQAGPSLLPKDPYLRARCRQLVEIVNAGTQPLVNLTAVIEHSKDPAEQKRWSQVWLKKGLTAYEALVRETAGRFSIGDELTLADICLVPHCYSALRNEVSLDAYPTIARINQAALETPAGRASHPDHFKPPGA